MSVDEWNGFVVRNANMMWLDSDHCSVLLVRLYSSCQSITPIILLQGPAVGELGRKRAKHMIGQNLLIREIIRLHRAQPSIFYPAGIGT